MWYTGKGDGGTSGLFGTRERLRKDHPVYHALGTLDELNCWLGIVKAHACASVPDMAEDIAHVQKQLFVMQAEPHLRRKLRTWSVMYLSHGHSLFRVQPFSRHT